MRARGTRTFHMPTADAIDVNGMLSTLHELQEGKLVEVRAVMQLAVFPQCKSMHTLHAAAM